MVDLFYGSDFFLESQANLYELFEKSPNPIERVDLLKRMSNNKYKFNKEKAQWVSLQYDLLPYCSDKDFNVAVDKGAVEPIEFQLQTRFNYWINLFEVYYGDIVVFCDGMESAEENQKLIRINNLLRDLIQKNVTNLTINNNGNKEENQPNG